MMNVCMLNVYFIKLYLKYKNFSNEAFALNIKFIIRRGMHVRIEMMYASMFDNCVVASFSEEL